MALGESAGSEQAAIEDVRETAHDITYRTDAFHAYMISDCREDESGALFEEKMLESNDSDCLLSFHVQSTDGIRQYYYEITSLTDLETYLVKTGRTGTRMLKNIIRSFVDICNVLDRYLLDPDSLLFGTGNIYIDGSGRLKMAYIPGARGNFAEGIREVAGRLMGSVDYKEKTCVLMAYEFYRRASLPGFSVKMLEELVNEEDVDVACGQKESGRGQQVPDQKENSPEMADHDDMVDLIDEKLKTGRDRKSLHNRRPSGYAGEDSYQTNVDHRKPKLFAVNKTVIIIGVLYCAAAVYIYESGILMHIGARLGIETMYLALAIMAMGCVGLLLVWMICVNKEDSVRSEDYTDKNRSRKIKRINTEDGFYDGETYGHEAFECGGMACEDSDNNGDRCRGVAGGRHADAGSGDDSFFSFSDTSGYSTGNAGETTVLGVYPQGNESGFGRTTGHGRIIKLASNDKRRTADITISSLPVVIGSNPPPSGISVNVTGVSRSHAIIESDGDDITVSDLYSTNGTFINGDKIDPNRRYTLNDGDELTIGDVEYTMQIFK